MKKTPQLLRIGFILAIILTLAVPYIAKASTCLSILYTKYNSGTWTSYQCDKQYTSVTIDIWNKLTYNGTGTSKTAFTNDTGDTPEGINIVAIGALTFEVYKIEGATEVKIASGSWAAGNATRLILSDQKLTIIELYDTDSESEILSGFSFGNYIEYVRVKGADPYTATDGFMQVDVGGGAGGAMTSAVTDMLPTIVSFAMLSIALGFIAKSTKG